MSGYCKFYKQKKQVSYDSGATWVDVTPYEYRKGDLYQANSPDCGYVANFNRWVESGTTCSNYNLYKLLVYQTSSDGINWVTTSITKLGDLIEANSSQCGSMYRWVETDEYGCHKDNMPLGNYKICGLRYVVSNDSSSQYQLLNELEQYEIPCDYTAVGDCQASPGHLTIEDTTNYKNKGIGGLMSASNIVTAYIGDCVSYIGSDIFGYSFKNNDGYCETNNSPSLIPPSTDQPDQSHSNIETIIMADSVTNIMPNAFRYCEHLTNIELSINLDILGSWAFERCSSLQSITLPQNISYLGERVFHECVNLTSITIPSNVRKIGNDLFWDCWSLSSATINADLTILEPINNQYPENIEPKSMFENCYSLQNVYFNNNIETIFAYMFFNCYSLAHFSIPNSVTSIKGGAFGGCSGLTSINIPSGVTFIGDGAFQGCSSLTSIIIPSGVTKINEYTFWNCDSLLSMTVKSTIPPDASDFRALPDNSNLTIYVPIGCGNAYESADGWSDYNIIETNL